MPTIESRLLKSVIFLYKDENEATRGDPGASGFLVGVPCAIPAAVFLFGVTNAHVVNQGLCTVRTAGPPKKRERVISRDQSDWIQHPDGDDLVVTPIGFAPSNNTDFYLGHVPSEWSVTPDNFTYAEQTDEGPQPRVWPFGPGEEVVMMGRFLGHDGVDENRPAVRFGNLAIAPPVPIDTPGFRQDSFIIECRSISGFSGSPIFIFRRVATIGGGTMPVGLQAVSEPRLLGIDWGNLDMTGRNSYEIDWVLPDAAETNFPPGFPRRSGMLVAIPAWKLSELLNTKEVQKVKRQAEDESAKASEGVNLDFQPSEFDEFKKLTRKLVAVPKRELDEKRRSDQE